MLENPTNPNADAVRIDMRAAAHALGRELIIGAAVVDGDIEGSVASLARQGIGGLLVRTGTCSASSAPIARVL